MLKKISYLLLFILTFNVAFANLVDLKSVVNDSYKKLITSSKSVYDNIESKIKSKKAEIETWDYKILSYLTWISIDVLENKSKANYQSLIEKLTSWKYDIISKLDLAKTNFDNGFITTWEYENKLQDIQSLISWYNIESNKDIQMYEKNMNDEIKNYIANIEAKKTKLSDKIEKYKNFKNQLTELNNLYKNLDEKNSKLQNIIWISKDLLDKKSSQIKEYVDNYFSWYVQKQYEKFLDSDENFSYFEKSFRAKKEIILWFVNNKLNGLISSIVSTYYPDIDFNSVKKQINEINNLSVKDVVNNYVSIENKIWKLKNTIKDYTKKVSAKLEKFNNSDKKSNILEVLKNDIVESIKNTLPTVEDELKNTFKNWKEFIKNKEEEEQTIMNNLIVSYNNVMISWDIQQLKEFKDSLDNYKDILVLPTNLETIRKYKLAIEKKIEELTYQEVSSKLNQIEKTIDDMQVWDNLKTIEQIKEKLKNIESNKKLYDDFIDKIKNIKLKLQLKENLNKLYEVWAIRYYYRYWDLSSTVANILKKYYEKYKKEWKEKIFEEKIKKAFDKLDILMSSLENDKRSYYIVMIYNGLLKFKAENL